MDTTFTFQANLAYASSLDQKDELAGFRQQFHIPVFNGKEAIYLCGNSLGLQPKQTSAYITKELDHWAEHGVEGHFTGNNPWLSYHTSFAKPLAKLTGAKPEEVVCMNALTVNLHLLFASFYQPKGKRTKILIEADCFPSDRFAVNSQVLWHNLAPEKEVVELETKNYVLETSFIIGQIKKYKDELAVVWLGGVNYFTGQVLDMQRITEAAHQYGIKVGFDLAHAIGNIELNLHNWQVDFATWCSYKYVNSGPGGVSGVYINQQYIENNEQLRLAGWWGTKESARFKMGKTFDPIPTAESWQLSNAPVLSMAAHKASLDIFEKVGFEKLLAKSNRLTGYLTFLLNELEEKKKLTVITPSERGCQLSVLVPHKGADFVNELKNKDVILDWREPADSTTEVGVMRVAPVPLYNTFVDVFRFVEILKEVL
ncbi:MAG: kynureninase [Cyclobacteriaceae bacterium]